MSSTFSTGCRLTHALWDMLSYFHSLASSYGWVKTIQIHYRCMCGCIFFWQQGKKISAFKQLLQDEVFVISGIIKVEVSVISRNRRLRLITLTEIIPDITKTESNNCFIILYLQVISQFLAGSMKRIEKPFLLRCPRTWHCCPCTWHCSWKSCIARATYRLFTKL